VEAILADVEVAKTVGEAVQQTAVQRLDEVVRDVEVT